jgi:hypothetical protein
MPVDLIQVVLDVCDGDKLRRNTNKLQSVQRNVWTQPFVTRQALSFHRQCLFLLNLSSKWFNTCIHF